MIEVGTRVLLPEDRTFIADILSQSVLFSYNPDERLFTCGQQKYDFEELPLNPAHLKRAYLDTEQPLKQGILALSSHHKPVQLPRLTNWLLSLPPRRKQELIQSVATVIQNEFVKMLGVKKPSLQLGEMSFTRLGHPEFVIATECDLGVNPYGRIRSRFWSYGLAEYDFHNVDTPDKRKVLLAGIGALAHLCAKEAAEK